MTSFDTPTANHLTLVTFNKPVQFQNQTETLHYSYRMEASMRPDHNTWQDEIAGVGDNAIVLVGQEDEALATDTVASLFKQYAPGATFHLLPGVNHFGIFLEGQSIQLLQQWLSELP